MKDNLFLSCLSTIIAIVTTFITLFSKNQKIIETHTDTYFNKLLVPYINEYKNNDNINAVDYIKSRYTLEDYYIPKYIFYLLDENNFCLLHKILVVDYWEIHPSKRKNIYKVMNNLSDIYDFLAIMALFFLSIMYTYGALSSGYLFISKIIMFRTITFEDVIRFFEYMAITVFFFYLSVKIFKNINDDYSIKNKDIMKNIQKREKDYDKNYDRFYIF
ncbi:hypothetical protein KWR14_017080 [Clostridioides difficile]|nr:hypothetical protein [uncultured Clostridioides sp.]EGT5422672.1 hypothetical protein [Clostridioides difficile]MBH7490683.1 hypothetical protein [Clostridioides difficile]MBY1673589.1 hypothetical protein [Clostridioides difficile]MBY1795744.1 hypothetical protein [Clostridioides difficile]MBY1999418.1 hypothetical protein [Clostridioides difficile]